MSEFAELASRCEQAEGPDREIDAAIMLAIGYRYEERDIGGRWDDGSIALGWVYVDQSGKWKSTRPYQFTGSLDAALKLVPAEAFWRLGHDGEGADPSLFLATVFEPRVNRASRPYDALALTPALALCAASLRAAAGEAP